MPQMNPFPVASSSNQMVTYSNVSAEELAKKELLQQRHYALFSELQKMAADLPQKFQQRLPYELLSTLARSLLDDTVFEIVRGLKDIQLMDERALFQTRKAVCDTQRETMLLLMKKQKEQRESLMAAGESPIIVDLAHQKEREEQEKLFQEELNRVDMKIITKLDQCVSDQQVTLEKAGVPGFFVTNSPMEIQLQMCLLGFISRLSRS